MKRTASLILCVTISLSFLMACGVTSEQPLTAGDYLSLGEKYLLDLDYEQALVQFIKVIEIEPMNPRGYTGAAEAYVGLGDTDSAVAVLNQGAQALPGNIEIQAMLEELQPQEEEYSLGAETNMAPEVGSEPEPEPELAPPLVSEPTPTLAPTPTSEAIPAEITNLFAELEEAIITERYVDAKALLLQARETGSSMSYNIVKINNFVYLYQVYYLGWLVDGTGKFLELSIDNEGGFLYTSIDMVDYVFTGAYDFIRYDSSDILTHHRYGTITNGQLEAPYYEDFYSAYLNDVYYYPEEPSHVQFDQAWSPYGSSFSDSIRLYAELPNGYIG